MQCRCEYELSRNSEKKTRSLFSSVENFDQCRFLELNIIQDGTPALTFKIEQEYFENNITDDDDNFDQDDDGFYSRTILQDELALAFDDTDDGYFHRR